LPRCWKLAWHSRDGHRPNAGIHEADLHASVFVGALATHARQHSTYSSKNLQSVHDWAMSLCNLVYGGHALGLEGLRWRRAEDLLACHLPLSITTWTRRDSFNIEWRCRYYPSPHNFPIVLPVDYISIEQSCDPCESSQVIELKPL
jgi:hypothetical protein